MKKKSLSNTNMEDLKKTTTDVKVHGDPGAWACLCKASSEDQGWMKSTKVMQLGSLGCLVQVTTQTRDGLAEALTFVPGAVLANFGL